MLLCLSPFRATSSTDAIRALASKRPISHDVLLAEAAYLARLPSRAFIHRTLARAINPRPDTVPAQSSGPRGRYCRGVAAGTDPIRSLLVSREILVTPVNRTSLEDVLMDEWQRTWSLSSKGSITHIFCSRVIPQSAHGVALYEIGPYHYFTC